MTFTLTLTALAMTAASCSARCSRCCGFRLQAAVDARRRLRQPDALDPLVLVIFCSSSWCLHRRLDAEGAQPDQGRHVLVGAHHLHHVRGRVLLRDHARRHPVDRARPGLVGLRARLDYWQTMGKIVLRRPSATCCVLLTQTIILFQDTSLFT